MASGHRLARVCVFALAVALAARYVCAQDAGAAWRADAAARIETYRMADLDLLVTDAAGNPLPDAEVRVEMQRHAFGFGATVDAHDIVENRNGDEFLAIVERYFNKVTFENDLKWGAWETSKTNTAASFRQEWTDEALAWLAERDIAVRGHYVAWGPLNSPFNMGYGSADTVLDRLFPHIAEKLPAIGDRVVEWDFFNHPVANWVPDTLQARYGNQVFLDVLNASRQHAPEGVELWINEHQILTSGSKITAYENAIQYLIDQGAPPDGIGFMGHFTDANLTSPTELYERMNRFAALVPRLQLTELDYDTLDEQAQADYLRDVMTVAFSHPAMEAIIMWGFWEGDIWKPNAALWREDWTIKPSGEAWLDLVYDQWWTDELLMTDALGNTHLRGFLGDYLVTVTHEDVTRQFELTLGSDGLSRTLPLGSAVPEPVSAILILAGIGALAPRRVRR